MNTLGIVIGALVMVGAFTLGWRWASRRWSLPCPSLLAWTLDNSLVVQSPLTLKTLDRIGFRPGEKVLDWTGTRQALDPGSETGHARW